jgi:hypothetical protein
VFSSPLLTLQHHSFVLNYIHSFIHHSLSFSHSFQPKPTFVLPPPISAQTLTMGHTTTTTSVATVYAVIPSLSNSASISASYSRPHNGTSHTSTSTQSTAGPGPTATAQPVKGEAMATYGGQGVMSVKGLMIALLGVAGIFLGAM